MPSGQSGEAAGLGRWPPPQLQACKRPHGWTYITQTKV